MSEIPPKHTPDASAYETPETGSGLVAMYNAASHSNAESFPVLKAFQDYIDAERAQARKRVMQLSIFFAVLMCVVVTGFLTAGIFMLRNMSTVQTKLLDVALANRQAPAPALQPAPAPIVQTSPLLEESVRQMSRATTELQSSMDKKLDGVSELTSKVHEKMASQDGELDKLRSELRRMQEQSAKLNSELVTMKTESKKAAVTAAPKVAPAPAVSAQPAPAPVAAAAKESASPVIAAPAPSVAIAPAAVAVMPPTPAVPPTIVAKPVRDPRFPEAVKEPPVSPEGVIPPTPPAGMMATAIPLKTKNIGTIPWRVLIPE